MSKLVLLLAVCCLCLLQVQANRNTCDNLFKHCLSHQRRTGATDDVTNVFNANCRKETRNWKNLTRCQLERAACIVTLVRCNRLSCANVAKVHSG